MLETSISNLSLVVGFTNLCWFFRYFGLPEAFSETNSSGCG